MRQREYMRECEALYGLERDGPLSDAELKTLIEIEEARWATRYAMLERAGDPMASFLTGTNVELVYVSQSAGTAKNTFTGEVQINDTAGMGVQAHLPPDFWLPRKQSNGQALRLVGRGILSSTATPTYTFTVRGGTAGNTSAAIMLGSAALTTGSGVANQMWELQGDVSMESIGAAGANSTIRGIGLLACGGLASPFSYPVWGGAASPGTAATLDTSIANYINFNVACSASSASNTITLQQLLVFGLN
jgi:hypothetical protein